MIVYKTPEQIELMRTAALLVGAAHTAVVPQLKEGITTKQINDWVETFLLDNGATPSFKGYGSYPYATCISVNEVVVHGFPGNHVLKSGDVLSLDIGAYLNGYHGDSAYTYVIGEVDEAVAKLVRITKESLYKGIEKAKEGNRLGDVAYAIQEHTEIKNGYGVVRALVGHGLGKKLHEDPQVPNFGKRGTGNKLKKGLTIAIEPMINLGTAKVSVLQDGWTVVTADGKPSAHFEHDIAITDKGTEILTSFESIEAAEKKNPNLFWSHSS